ncbi:probable RNA-binding protein 18 [Neodiprion pinetum]|uniref:probable RNA-binding protein 18 n=1 Tax=Neodiprion pinetum TaxID=441929 RepID=UPI001EE07DAF|nr:probable RNA-binding protein 18 [Neodiprion pinetum]XP_046606235.1 probable RNA-binding protein 18 [Neodiprion virginianus]
MDTGLQIPLPLDCAKSNNLEDRRLWVGNLDPRINEYQLLKLVQKHGKIEKFDLLFHRSGPQAGQPRGYAFVTYETSYDAEKAKDALHNIKIGAKTIVVRWAHSVNESDMEKPKPKIDIPALAGAKKEDKKVSRETAIQAIEAKLKMMNESEEEFELNKPLVGTPILQQYQSPENIKPSTSNRYHNHRGSRYQSNKPYSRPRPRR